MVGRPVTAQRQAGRQRSRAAGAVALAAGLGGGVVWGLVVAGLSGCDKGHTVVPGLGAQSAAETFTALAPERVRVHPLSRVGRAVGMGPASDADLRDEDARPKLVLHIEAVDAWGRSVQWPVEVEVRCAGVRGRPSGEEAGERGAVVNADAAVVWRRSLLTGEANAGAFDWISRSYVLVLELPAEWGVGLYKSGGAGGGGADTKTTSADVPAGADADAVLPLSVTVDVLLPDGTMRRLEAGGEVRAGE
ncbi:MAG: hypothetical protein LW650_04615 [Planctomycetaceae bacterium]|nr:hypothetical protein [Planctomycetaceae bacterium]